MIEEAPQNPAHAVRLQCRANRLTGPTSGLAPGHMQANLIILPSAAASHFRSLCARNPVPCPLLGSTPAFAIGDPTVLDDDDNNNNNSNNGRLISAPGLDLRTDLPLYNIYREGRLVEQKRDIRAEWSHDHVAFLIGCSFGFEAALDRAGLRPRHWELAGNVPMYRTRRRLNPAGVFTNASYVVSMRPYRLEDVERVRDVTRPFERMHGEPIAWGWEGMRELGIEDISKPEFGESVEIREGEVPVFWGCGVTPQVAVAEAGHKIQGTVIAHAPGHMLVLDMTEEDITKIP